MIDQPTPVPAPVFVVSERPIFNGEHTLQERYLLEGDAMPVRRFCYCGQVNFISGPSRPFRFEFDADSYVEAFSTLPAMIEKAGKAVEQQVSQERIAANAQAGAALIANGRSLRN